MSFPSLKAISRYVDLSRIGASILGILVIFMTISASAQTTIIKIDGSSTVFPIAEAVAEEFQNAYKGKIRVTVGISGTGGGFKKFCRGETDVQNASRPIQTSEMEICKKAGIKYFELPVGFDATVIVVNPKNTWVNGVTVAELKTMWEPAAQGKIKKWNQVNAKWPDQSIKLFGAGSDSGTFDYFTEAVVGKAKSSRGDYTASEDDNTLVQGVANDVNALGYLPMAYADENKAKLKAVSVAGVLASLKTVEDGTYTPLSRPIFIYVNEASYKKFEVAEFTKFFLKNAPTLVPEAKYVSLPASAYQTAQEHLDKGKLGTVFGGHSEVGLKINDLLKKEGKL